MVRPRLMNRLIDSSNSLLLSVALLLSSLGCAAAVTVSKEDVPEVVQDFQANVVTHGELSQISLQYLRMQGLDATTAEDPIAFLKSIEQTKDDEKLTKLYTLAEYALRLLLISTTASRKSPAIGFFWPRSRHTRVPSSR